LNDVGEEVRMPWEIDGRRWHTQERVARNGKPCRWDGKILGAVIDKIQELGDFSPTNYNARSVVEISADRKSDGWFFHAVTGEEWLLKLKFRTAKSTFRRETLVEQLDLKPLNEMRDLPVYGTEPRVKCKNLRGPWQEVQLQVHSWNEIDKPSFWHFLEAAVKGFTKFTDKVEQSRESLMPWKVLGQKWHFARKGFPPGKKIAWDTEVLEELCELLSDTHEGQFLWNNQQLVHYCLKGRSDPWATIQTKKLHAVELHLNGPKNKFALGRVTEFGVDPAMDKDRPDRDVVRLQFNDADQVAEEALGDFLREHAAAVLEK
jgi:excinuclease ABC subunit A